MEGAPTSPGKSPLVLNDSFGCAFHKPLAAFTRLVVEIRKDFWAKTGSGTGTYLWRTMR
jgi:hypothetical protein